ncbi:hypothetical protein BDE40_1456 [Litoreibacter halocynthiae]|uniref:Uncharacterized protein n=1 Tax=Litoreibacter halocynthiae TaxID=1242689 RepID=A0A4R7LRI1_9RHOB|nr:hypothetical protein [Litoreibacter halocynthiae]TDT78149.1 hypothetical protein BDE40_1456 [Litoreibacter halocynthiae]
MKLMQLFDETDALKSNAGERLVAIKYYPSDALARDQLVMLLETETKRARTLGASEYAPSELSAMLVKSLQVSEGKRGIAGLLSLCLLILLKKGLRPTQYAAAQMTEKLVNELKDDDGRVFYNSYFQKGELVRKSYRNVTARSDIEKRFRHYNSIAPLMAASILHTMNNNVIPFPEVMNQEIPRLLRTLAEIERTVVDVFPEYFPEPWRIAASLPKSIRMLKPFDLPADMRKAFGVNSLW